MTLVKISFRPDGEDDVSQIPKMINKAIQNPNHVVVSCRTKRKRK